MKIHSAVLELLYAYRRTDGLRVLTYLALRNVANKPKNGRNDEGYVQTEETRKEFKQTRI
jgi:hypothetical protein